MMDPIFMNDVDWQRLRSNSRKSQANLSILATQFPANTSTTGVYKCHVACLMTNKWLIGRSKMVIFNLQYYTPPSANDAWICMVTLTIAYWSLTGNRIWAFDWLGHRWPCMILNEHFKNDTISQDERRSVLARDSICYSALCYRPSVCPSVRRTGGSVKNGWS